MANGSDRDEYDAYNDFADLTEEDFERLDAVSNPPGPTRGTTASEQTSRPLDSGLPSVSIEVEGAHTSSENVDGTPASPLRKYRRGGTLSVTDLISLAWCEVQFDYGLRQKVWLKLADRPASFQGVSGKEIVVQQDVAAKNDKTTKRGRFIHKELELELIKPEEIIQIIVNTQEEQWALRLLNFLSSLVGLSVGGCAREVPVFGIVQDVVVVGIIDELSFKIPEDSESGAETGTKRASDLPLPSPKRTCRSPSPTSCEAEGFTAPTVVTTPALSPQFRVIDTKTRRSESLPSDEDAEPARLQVMLYRRLLTALLETSTPFDFPAFWARLSLNPSAPFSDRFLQQTAVLLGEDAGPTCLEDAVVLLRARVAELGLPAVDDTLQIVYRSQNKYPRRSRKGKGRETPLLGTTREDDDIAKAIEMSLAEVFDADLATALKESALEQLGGASPGPQTDKFGLDIPRPQNVQESGPSVAQDLSTILENPEFASILNNAPVERQSTVILGDPADPETNSPAPVPEEPHRSEIIGTKEFRNDDALLDAYLTNALQWWHGLRKARGVTLRQTGRCFSCPYYNDCEWREEKSLELRQNQKQKVGTT
ncbi:exonuclease V [Mycena maculata]|uniref:Exonuclease V n=1 Tax=Mycena maculata TaxID=230809 RepID=A0AAD7NHB8_9AGAR|nr:exonuclease V [Mycena maculata]